ncbi:MAG: GTP-binding protein EngB [Candidatus Hadarchaeum sp.]|nr:GTP-binding protein EngB [Candidatus Hadarchaeum sp.]
MEILLLGRSNVGKSSVIRKLTGKRVPVGKRPGVTRKPLRLTLGELEIIDMPGFGYMAGMSRERQETVKTEIVRYVEKNRENIIFVLEVIDARAFSQIVERWERREQVPVDIEMFQFLQEMELHPIVVVNKIDLIYPEERDTVLDEICEKLGLQPPWRQWLDTIVPISAKSGEGIQELKKLVKQRFSELGQERLQRYIKQS